MNRLLLLSIFILTISTRTEIYGINPEWQCYILPDKTKQDTLIENQNLYTGKLWVNKFQRIAGDQFLFAGYFLPGTISANGKTFNELKIRYDIYNDEIMIPAGLDEIVQVNKEMVDSFSVVFKNQVYRFAKITLDTLNGRKNLNGYFCVSYKQRSALYTRYKKNILVNVTDKSDGEFIETQTTYFVKDGIVYPIVTKNHLYKALGDELELVRKYVKEANLKLSGKRPESYVPVIKFYDSISH